MFTNTKNNTQLFKCWSALSKVKLSNYETQRKAEYELFTANVKEVKMTTKIRFKESTILYRSKSKTFIEVQYIGDCSITTDKIIHP
jgi:hypothetical protein